MTAEELRAVADRIRACSEQSGLEYEQTLDELALNDAPRLLAEVRRLQAELERMSEIAREWLKPGELVFDMLGRPIGIVSEVTDDEFRAVRRGTFFWQAGVSTATGGRVIDSGEGWAVVEIGETQCETS